MRGRGIALVAGARMGQRSAAQQAQVQEQQHQAELQTQKAQMEAQQAQQQAQAQAQAASAPKVDITAELQKLAQLHQSGVLSDAEFATAKQKLLSQ
jgi:hemolysin activation/secretion protein